MDPKVTTAPSFSIKQTKKQKCKKLSSHTGFPQSVMVTDSGIISLKTNNAHSVDIL